jgi:hypothetical protein
MAGVKHAAVKIAENSEGGETACSDRPCVDVSITNERGERHHYLAQAVTLQIVQGGIQILHDPRGCFAWFDRCRLEVSAGLEHLVLRLASGVASSRGREFAVVATVDPILSPTSKLLKGKRLVRRTKTNGQVKSE